MRPRSKRRLSDAWVTTLALCFMWKEKQDKILTIVQRFLSGIARFPQNIAARRVSITLIYSGNNSAMHNVPLLMPGSAN